MTNSRVLKLELGKLFDWIVLVSASVLYFNAQLGVRDLTILMCLFYPYLKFVGLLLGKKGEKFVHKVLSIDMFFLFGSYLVLFLPYQLYLFGIFDISYSRFLQGRTYWEQSDRALYLSTIGLSGFFVGWNTLIFKEKFRGIRDGKYSVNDSFLSRIVVQISTLIITAGTSIYVISGARALGEVRYARVTAAGRPAEALYFIVSLFVMILTASLLFRKASELKFGFLERLGLIVAGYWQLRLLVSGDRNMFFLILSVQLAGYLLILKPRNIKIIFLLIPALGMLYFVIENIRGISGSSISVLFSNGFFDFVRSRILIEPSFNISAVSLRGALNLVPSNLDYTYGYFKLVGILGIIPFSRELFFADSTFTETSSLISYYVNGPSSLWQTGTTLIGDIYIDFGTFGVIVLSILVGFLGRIIQLRFFARNDFPTTVVFLISLSVFLQYSRYTWDFPIRFVLWTAMFIVAVNFYANSLTRREAEWK